MTADQASQAAALAVSHGYEFTVSRAPDGSWIVTLNGVFTQQDLTNALGLCGALMLTVTAAGQVTLK